MNSKDKSIQDLQAIRLIMEKSSKFISLSGLSGVFAGLVALAAAAHTYFNVLNGGTLKYDERLHSLSATSTSDLRLSIALIGGITLLIALTGASFFSIRKAKKSKQKLWNKTSKMLLIHLAIPLMAGGAFAFILAYHNNIQLVASVTLIFYGLALVNGGKYTFGEITYLGICEIILGLFAGFFLSYGIVFWATGFGLLHIIYGIFMFLKYDQK